MTSFLVADVAVLVFFFVDERPHPRVIRVVGHYRCAVTAKRFGPTLISTFGLAFRL